MKTMERFCGPDRANTRSPHPIFGDMREREWLRWGYLPSITTCANSGCEQGSSHATI